jgi:predicted pyridoxine 5'-phosphate oxidase superfamily flavin-nucleotide-binding protein
MRRVLLAIAALTVAALASAGEPNWVRVSAAADQDVVDFIDTNSIAIRHGRLTARYLWNFEAIQTDSITHKPYQSETGLGVYDCLKRQTGAIEITLYGRRDARGRVDAVLRMSPRNAQMTDVEPDSMGEEEVAFVCHLWGNRAAQWSPEGWHRIGEASGPPPTRVYLSPATLRAQPDGTVRALFMSDYGVTRSDEHGSSRWRSRQYEVLIDCENQRLAETRTRAYFAENLGAGRAERYEDPGDQPPRWQRASPDSLSGSEVRTVCSIWSEMHAGVVSSVPDAPTSGAASDRY